MLNKNEYSCERYDEKLKKLLSALLSLSIFVSLLVSCSQETPVATKTYNDNYRNFYEIYVRSFSDTNDDGIGDLQGVISKIDYLKAPDGQDDSQALGIDAVWLMPIFTSPSEHKYDVTNYYEIDSTYGTMDDFDELLQKFHQRGIHLILDLVLNHTSSKHPWFKQAVADLNNGVDSQYVHYYNFTTEPPVDEEGNVANGFHPVEGNEEGYYYEGQFVDSMPDLNLDNPDVLREIKDIMKFWLDKGVDGFRLDAVKYFFSDSQEKSIDFLKTIVDYGKSVNPDCYFVGEVWDGVYTIAQFYKSGIDSIFNFDCSYMGPYQGLYNNISTGNGEKLARHLEEFNTEIRNKNLNAIDAPFISNHDTPRSGTYLTGSADRKLAASLYMMLPGNSFIYYGEEIGMTEGWNNDSEKRLAIKWSADENGENIIRPQGAAYVKPPQFGVYDQLKSPDSLVCHYQKLIRLKKKNPEIQRAQVVSACDIQNRNVAAYTCAYDDSAVMVLQNLTPTIKHIDLKAAGYSDTYTQVSGFVIADDYVEQEAFKAYIKDYEYEVPDVKANASPICYVDGMLIMPPRATIVLRNTGKVNATFVPTTTTTVPAVSPTDVVTPSDVTVSE